MPGKVCQKLLKLAKFENWKPDLLIFDCDAFSPMGSDIPDIQTVPGWWY